MWKIHIFLHVKDGIQRELTGISRQDLHCVSRIIFRRCKTCLQAGGPHGDVKWQGKRDSKFLAHADLKYYTASVTAAVLWEQIKDMLWRWVWTTERNMLPLYSGQKWVNLGKWLVVYVSQFHILQNYKLLIWKENSSERKLPTFTQWPPGGGIPTAQALHTTKHISLQLYCQSNPWCTHC